MEGYCQVGWTRGKLPSIRGNVIKCSDKHLIVVAWPSKLKFFFQVERSRKLILHLIPLLHVLLWDTHYDGRSLVL